MERTPKKENSKLIKSLKVLIAAAVFNQVGGALCPSLVMTFYESKIKPAPEEIGGYGRLSPDSTARDYVDLANLLVKATAAEKNPLHEVDCKDYALATRDTYLVLIKEDQRGDLEEKIRVVAGIPPTASGFGHVWLEVEENNQFLPYEPDSASPNKSRINGDIDKEGWTMTRSFNGSTLFHPTLESFFYPGGLARLMYNAYALESKEE